MLFFTADAHFGHANILKLCGRPFDTLEDFWAHIDSLPEDDEESKNEEN